MPETTAGIGGMGAPGRTPRVDWVDFAKGMCIIFVVMMHSTLGVEKAAQMQGWMHAFVQFAKPFRMPDFFLISGLFLGLVIDRPWRRYLDRKVLHFAYFYVLWMTIQFVVKAPQWMAEGQTPAEIARLYALGFVEPFGTLWFIYLLPVFFVVTRLVKGVHWLPVLAAAAILEMLPVRSGWMVIDEFAARYVYFLAGYLFAPRIFAFVDWARAHRPLALACLACWFVLNASLTWWPAPPALAAGMGLAPDAFFLSDLPVVSLVLGCLGAGAIIVGTALLSLVPWMRFLGYVGRNSIVVYLAFFLPMAVSRMLLLRLAPGLDVGTVSLLVTMAGVTGPLVLHALISWSGYGRFLFERPQWARIERPAASQPARPMGLSPAE